MLSARFACERRCLDALLVAGDGRGGDDDGVVGGDAQGLVLARRHAGQGAHRFALAARAQHDDLVVGYVGRVVGVDEVLLVDMQVAELTCHACVGDHRAARHDDLAPDRGGGVADLLEPVDVA